MAINMEEIMYSSSIKTNADENKIYSYATFDGDFETYINNADTEEKFYYKENTEKKVLICPEPYAFIRKFDENEGNPRKCCRIFARFLEDKVQAFTIERINFAKNDFWLNTSINGINLRVGLKEANTQMIIPIQLDEDKNGHAVILGRAGTGKTELLYDLIFSALREYSPFELTVYLANFQAKGEIATFLTSHAALCEDYSEAKDILSLLKYAEYCMHEREVLFSRLGIETLSEINKCLPVDYKGPRVLLPSKLFVIDRMTAVLRGASAKEVMQIRRLLQSIGSSGSRCGIHLIISYREIDPDTIGIFQNKILTSCTSDWAKVFDIKTEQIEQRLEADNRVLIKTAEREDDYLVPLFGVDDSTHAFYQAMWIQQQLIHQKDRFVSEIFKAKLDEISASSEQDSVELIDRLNSSTMTFQEIGKFNKFINKRNATLDFRDFQNCFVRAASKTDRLADEIEPEPYGKGSVILCPEPFTFLKRYDEEYNRYTGDQKEQEIYWNIFKKDLEEGRFQTLDLTQKPSKECLWLNTTAKGINLRPGLLNKNRNSPFAVPMGNNMVHGLVVGRTGSGKSVFLNNLIFNLLYEYAPWELDLYLVDFKKVELSRYMTNGFTPHVNACAATSEVRYVCSVIQYLVECMNARQDFFSRIGVKDIAAFRYKAKKELNCELVLPRVLLLVDEFQQMFLEATSKEADKIDGMLTAITKLGRATGFHLLFASQEMSQTLSPNAFANFKIRFALPCDESISTSILGNKAASDLKIGEVLLNTESGAEDDNWLYKVPFINDENEKYFYDYIAEMREETKKYNFHKTGKFYEEDKQEKISTLQSLIEVIKEIKRKKLKAGGNRFFDIITLGKPVVYNHMENDWETFFIERGMNKNIIALSPNIDDLLYVQKMLAINFGNSSNTYHHIYFSLNQIIRNRYQIEKDLGSFTDSQTACIAPKIIESADQLENLNFAFSFKKSILDAIQKAGGSDEKFLQNIPQIEGVNISKDDLRERVGGAFCCDRIQEICKSLDEKDDGLKKILQSYYNFKKSGGANVFDPVIVWISGCENIGDVLEAETLKFATDVNMIFIFFASSAEDMDIDLKNSNDYIFLGGNYEALYDRFDVPYTKKSRDSIVIDFKIKSLNTVRSFKKCNVEFGKNIVPALDFDKLI